MENTNLMKEFAFYLKPLIDSDEAWQQLEEAGCQPLYSSEDPDGSQIVYGRLPNNLKSPDILELCPAIALIEAASFSPIDWNAQWENHGENFHDGFVHIQLQDFAPDNPITLQLKPGPGFGDLSHPTTRLVLSQMADLVKNKYVVDIGCGSGILALAAHAMGAKRVIGVDIDADAINHAYQNAEINGMTKKIEFLLPEQCNSLIIKPEDEIVVLMNMIQSEQAVAWQSMKTIHQHVQTIITSGILVEGAEAYLKQCHKWNWKEVNRVESEGWLGFRFEMGH